MNDSSVRHITFRRVPGESAWLGKGSGVLLTFRYDANQIATMMKEFMSHGYGILIEA